MKGTKGEELSLGSIELAPRPGLFAFESIGLL